MELVAWLTGNYVHMLEAMGAVVVAAELITRLTPTKKDDGFVERIGSALRVVMDFLKVPNLKSKK